MADDQREPSKGETMKPTNGKERVVSKPTDRKKKGLEETAHACIGKNEKYCAFCALFTCLLAT